MQVLALPRAEAHGPKGQTHTNQEVKITSELFNQWDSLLKKNPNEAVVTLGSSSFIASVPLFSFQRGLSLSWSWLAYTSRYLNCLFKTLGGISVLWSHKCITLQPSSISVMVVAICIIWMDSILRLFLYPSSYAVFHSQQLVLFKIYSPPFRDKNSGGYVVFMAVQAK